jgi:hypothetical protein
MYTIEDIRAALKDRVIIVVAERTGLHRETLYNLTNGRQKGMSLETYTKLVDYLFDGKTKNHG